MRLSPVFPHFGRWPGRFAMLLAVMSNSVLGQASLPAALDEFLRIQTQGLPGKVSYGVGQLDQHAQNTPCSAFEPFLPPGGRLWGKAMVGVRCLAPKVWTVYVPVQVRITGNYLVTARQLIPGQVVASADLRTHNEGKALNNATEGQIAQVRTASGQVVSGVARSPGVVEVSY